MPTTVNVPGRGTLTFDDNVSDEEIQQIVQKEFPVNGEDVVRSIAEDPSYAQRMSRDDFMEMRKYKEDKPVDFSAKLAEAFGGIGELVSNAFTTAPKFDPQAGPIEKGVSLVANIGQGAMVGAGDFGNMFISVIEGYSDDNNSYTRYRLANDLKDTPENKAAYERIIDSDFESFKGLQTWQQSRKDILGQASMPAMAETISLVAQPPLPGAALLQAAGVGARVVETGAKVAQMAGKGIQAVGKATTAAANVPQRVAGAAARALTESEQVGSIVEKAVATGSTGLAAGQLGGFAIPGLSTAATTIAGAKAVGKGLEVAGEVTQKLAEHAGKKAGRLGVFESLANDLSASPAARAIGRIGSVAGADIVAPYVSAAIQGAAEGAIIGGTIGFITDGEEGAAGGMGAGLALGGAGGLAGRGYAQASGMIRQNKIVNDALRGIASLEPESRANASRLFDQFIKDGNQEAVAEMVDAKNWLSSDVYFSFINNEQARAMPAADGTSFEGITVFPSAVTGGKPAIYINVDTVKPGTGFHESFHGAMRTALGETFGKKFTDVIDQTFTPEEKVQFAEDYIKRGGTEEGKQKLRDYLAEKQNLPEEIGAEYFREFLQRRENRDLLLRGQRTTDGSLIAATKGAIDYTLNKLGIDYDATGTGYKGMDALASELIKARTDINKSIAQNGKPLAPVPLDKMPTPKLADWAKQHGQSDVLLKDPTTGDVIGVKTEEQVNIGRDAANARAAEEIANVPRGTNAPNDAELAIYQKHFTLEQFLKLTFASEAIKSGNVLNGDYFPATAKKGETSVYASRGMTNLDFVPYKIRTTKKNVMVIDYVDLTQLKARFDDIMSRSKILEQWGGDKDAAWQDVMAYTKNLSLGEGVAKPSAELFGPIKRDIINKIYGFVPTKAQISDGTIKNISSLGTNIAAESGTGKSQIGKPAYEGSRDTRVVSTMRLDRLGRIADTGRQFSFNENGTYGLSQVNFKPAETLGKTKVFDAPDSGFRIISKSNNKHSLYAPTGERVGIYDTQAGAERKANITAAKLQPEIRQQQSDSESFTISRSDMGRFMPASDKVKLEDYADRKIIALAADRMGIGQMSVGPKGEKRDLSLLGQGGRGFMNIFNGGGWAFSDKKTADRFISRLKEDADRNGNATVGITIQSPINHLKNQTGQLAYIEAMQAAIDSKTITRSAADAQIAAMSSAIVRSKDKNLTASAREKFSQINTLKELKKVVKGRGLNFDDMSPLLTQMQRKKLPITDRELTEMGMTAADIARDLADPELADLPSGSVVALLGVNVNQTPSKTDFHYSYPWTVHGEAIGFLDKFYNIADLSTEKRIRNAQGAVTTQPLQMVMPVMDNIINTIKTQQGIPSDPAQRVNFMPDDAKNLASPNANPNLPSKNARLTRTIPKSRFYVVSDERGRDFADAIARTAKEHPRGAAVTVKPAEFYYDPENFLYLSEDGLAGAAVKSDGDLVSVFKHPASTARMQNLLTDATAASIKLDAFDIAGFLPNYYSNFGFRPVARIAWSDDFAPPRWNFETMGRPDVVVMVKDADNVLGLPDAKVYNEAARQKVPLVDYEQAVQIQSNAVAKLKAAGKTPVNYMPDAPDTPEFKKWFGDSKVVDESGKPQPVYRGGPAKDWRTGKDITEFKSKNGPWAGFFTSDPNVGSKFAEAFNNGVVTPAFVNISKPLEIDATEKSAKEFQIDASVVGGIDSPIRKKLLSGSYDGLILRNTSDEGDIFVPLKPNQIKSATGNAGTFDSTNPDIRFQPSEKLPNGQAWSTNMNYRVIQKTGGKYRIYAPTGALIGVEDTLEKSKKLIAKKSPAP